MKIVDIADELYRELESPSSLSIASIAFWLRTNYGKLNTLIDAEFEIVESGDYEMSPTPNEEEKAIFKQLFVLYFFITIRSIYLIFFSLLFSFFFSNKYSHR